MREWTPIYYLRTNFFAYQDAGWISSCFFPGEPIFDLFEDVNSLEKKSEEHDLPNFTQSSKIHPRLTLWQSGMGPKQMWPISRAVT